MARPSLPRRFRDACLRRLSSWLRAIETEDRRRHREQARAQLTASLKACGKGTHVRGEFNIFGASEIALGSNVHIGPNAFIRGEGGLSIGDNTHISRNLVLYTVNHRYEGSRVPYDEELVAAPVTIGRNVWIGMNVTIAPGTTIGDGAIVGLGTSVFGEVPALAIIGSEKWRILGRREADRYHSLDQAGDYGGTDGRPLDD
jgi:maltose O-acetyltransferase